MVSYEQSALGYENRCFFEMVMKWRGVSRKNLKLNKHSTSHLSSPLLLILLHNLVIQVKLIYISVSLASALPCVMFIISSQ